jgi:amino acid transporter
MEVLVFTLINVALIVGFVIIIKKKDFLSFFHGGRWWLTWLAVGIITLMDEMTSIYYAPFEAYRFIGLKAIFYIAITSLLIRYMTTRFIEISNILEVNNIRGGGVYSFSYLVLGPNFSFIAVASILVDYVLTATISTVSAVENGTAFFGMTVGTKYAMMFGVVWFISFLNIMGIKENAKFTFGIFVFAAFVLINLIVGGFLNFDERSLEVFKIGWSDFASDFTNGNPFATYGLIITGIGSCILAYSGVESVLQTASLVQNWKQIKKAYYFLALTVGIVTPLIAMFALTSSINIGKHETDLIPALAQSVNGPVFGFVLSILASLTLIMAVNTAMVASAELMDKVAEKYNFHWLVKENRRQSLYRIHIINAIFYSFILVLTSGNQAILAEMYAVGLVASFVINTGSLLKYRYSKGSKQIEYAKSRLGTLILFIILTSTLIYIMVHRPYGTELWFIITMIVFFAGLRISKYRSPEISVRKLSRSPMEVLFALAEAPANKVNIHFKRPQERDIEESDPNSVFVSFYSARTEHPEPKFANHFWLSIQSRWSLFDMIYGLLKTIEYDMPPEKEIHVHFGWPLSSWLDRFSIGVMVFNIIHLPRKFKQFHFHIDYRARKEEKTK